MCVHTLSRGVAWKVVPFLFRIGLHLPSGTRLSCRFSRGVLTAFLFVNQERWTDGGWTCNDEAELYLEPRGG